MAVDLPAHPALRPLPLHYEPISGEVADTLRRDLGARAVDRARTAHAAPYGYYRVTGEQALFVKVSPRERLSHVQAVQALVTQLQGAGCPVQPMLGAPLHITEDAMGLIYPYIPERFAQDSTTEAGQVGAALRGIHEALSSIAPSVAPAKISEQWHAVILRLRNCASQDPLVGEKAADILSRWEAVVDMLDQGSQLIHNDYHRGNVLMGPEGVVAVLDFDDAIAATGSPLIDLAIGLERFCLAGAAPALGARLSAAFLGGYGRGLADLSAGELECIATARLLFSLGILHANPRWDDPGWQAEHEKFIGLLANWQMWRQMLVEAGLRP